jgi:hypothetical protein
MTGGERLLRPRRKASEPVGSHCQGERRRLTQVRAWNRWLGRVDGRLPTPGHPLRKNLLTGLLRWCRLCQRLLFRVFWRSV